MMPIVPAGSSGYISLWDFVVDVEYDNTAKKLFFTANKKPRRDGGAFARRAFPYLWIIGVAGADGAQSW